AIITTLLLGFYIIPDCSVKLSVFFVVIGLLLFLTFVSYKFLLPGRYGKKYYPSIILLLIIFFCSKFYFSSSELYKKHKITYESEGLLGQVTVVDHYCTKRPHSSLHVNGITQTKTDIETGFSLWRYIHIFSFASAVKPEGSKALILGIGGGSLVKEFMDLGFEVDICELDQRMVDVSANQFNAPVSSADIYIDDARHYIKTTQNKYDIVVFDIALGEIQPSHIFTIEAFNELKKILKDDKAFVFINYTDHSLNKIASKSIYLTIEKSGFIIKAFDTKKDAALFMALLKEPEKSSFKVFRSNPCCLKFGTPQQLLSMHTVDTDDAMILTDDKPVLDIINLATNRYYRNLSIKNYIIKRIEGDAF
ncbi:MAG: fused MFS/spermidine synthase, partial [Bacteroidetes bacterium]|nr:fused MFS/spermidine synthase [Bacteroidota bacterium]